MKLRYGYIQNEMKKKINNKLMRHSKWRQNNLSTFNFDFTIKPLQKVCLKKIVEGTDVFTVLPETYI